MKAKFKAKITEVKNLDGTTSIGFFTPAAGKVDTRAMNAQDAFIDGNMQLKALIGNQIKIGATFTITVTDEESEEGLG